MLFFIAFEDYGFLRNAYGVEAGRTTHNIREARPFDDWYKADKVAREVAINRPYAILSTTTNVAVSYSEI